MSARSAEVSGVGATDTKTVSTGHSDEPHLARKLSNRHIQMIAIGGAIGTGLFMGSGKTISLAGPAVLFVYMIIGFMLFFVMRAMGEVLLSNLEYKTFGDFAGDLARGAGICRKERNEREESKDRKTPHRWHACLP